MKITIEVTFEADYTDYNDKIEVATVTFPGCTQNILQFLSPAEQAMAQSEVEDAYYAELEAKAQRRQDLKDMRGDHFRELAKDIQREELLSRQNQRGHR